MPQTLETCFFHIIFQASIRQLQIQQSSGQNDIVRHDVNKFPPFVRASTSFQAFYLSIYQSQVQQSSGGCSGPRCEEGPH